MPVPREKVEKGLDKTKYQILEFLKKNQSYAFNIWEIVENLGISTKSVKFPKLLLVAWSFGTILDEMVEEGLIDKKMNDGQIVYLIHKG